MYGLVNKAIEQMICTQFGEETWEAIKERAGIDVDAFINMEGYPDEVTYQLVRAASSVLEISPAAVLEAFGAYWVTYTAAEGYGVLLDLAGATLPEFLRNLDHLHARVGLTFTHLQPPSFQCIDERDDSLQLHYYSSREGLAHLVIGLLKGLGHRFNTDVAITHTQARGDTANHDTFLVQYGALDQSS
jgi:hypothetical protein